MRIFPAFSLRFLLKLEAIHGRRSDYFGRSVFGLFNFWCHSTSWLCCWHSWRKFQSGGSFTPLLIMVFNAKANDVICNHTATVKPYGTCLLLFMVKAFMLLVSWSTELYLKWCFKALLQAVGGSFMSQSNILRSSLWQCWGKSAPPICLSGYTAYICNWTEQERNVGTYLETKRDCEVVSLNSYVEKKVKCYFLGISLFALNKQTNLRIEITRLKKYVSMG